jgi:hypothetical protein
VTEFAYKRYGALKAIAQPIVLDGRLNAPCTAAADAPRTHDVVHADLGSTGGAIARLGAGRVALAFT